MKVKKIPTILGIATLAIALAAGVVATNQKQLFQSGASADQQPQNVRVSNIDNQSITITWTTSKGVSGFVNWGSSQSQTTNTELDSLPSSSYVHSVTLKNLSPSTNYYFKISSGGTIFDNSGSPWQSLTGPTISGSPISKTISGTLLKSTGSPAANALVFLSVQGAAPLSTTTSENGSFVFPVSNLRDTSLTKYANATNDAVVEISAQAGPDGTSTAQVLYGYTGNLPSMVLGQVHDFRDQTGSSNDSYNIGANLSLGTSANESTTSGKTSGFDFGEIYVATPSATTVTLDSIDDGEVVTTVRPEFFGSAPVGTEISIELNSTVPLSDTVTVGSSGNWSWSPPQSIEEGEHTIKISWTDAQGVLRSITKSFVVSAAQGPAFVSTPSAGTPSATLPPQPVSGFSLPTILMFILAVALMGFGISAVYLAK